MHSISNELVKNRILEGVLNNSGDRHTIYFKDDSFETKMQYLSHRNASSSAR